jgi:hypothetical protein
MGELLAPAGKIGVGKHGLIRLQTADHNDGILGQFKCQNASNANHSVAVKSGESVMNSALASYALRQYAAALQLSGAAAAQQGDTDQLRASRVTSGAGDDIR